MRPYHRVRLILLAIAATVVPVSALGASGGSAHVAVAAPVAASSTVATGWWTVYHYSASPCRRER
jgi:hypothetical protein